LEEPAGEDDVGPHEIGEEVDHRGMADQFADRPTEPLGLDGGAGLGGAVRGVPHLGRREFLLDPGNLPGRDDRRKDHIPLDLKVPNLLRPGELREVRPVEMHEANFVVGGGGHGSYTMKPDCTNKLRRHCSVN
jgi:hypothetical protein